MSVEEKLRESIKNIQSQFCKDNDIPEIWPIESQFDQHYKRYRLQGFTVEESRKWAYERSQ